MGLRERLLGTEDAGRVFLRNFDEGIITTLGAVVLSTPDHTGYFLRGPPWVPPPGQEGIRVLFDQPEEVLARMQLPYVHVRRDSFDPVLFRWHPGAVVFRAPAPGASLVRANIGSRVVTGYDRVATHEQSAPFDLTYAIRCVGAHRDSPHNGTSVHDLFRHVLQTYQPYAYVALIDSIGDRRTYHTFTEGTSSEDEGNDVGERLIVLALSVRVAGELDLEEPTISSTTRSITQTVRPR